MSEPIGPIAPGRRVVTGVNDSGKSTIVSDGPVPANATWSMAGMGGGGDLWVMEHVPADLADPSDPLVGYEVKDWPAPGGVIVRMSTWRPGFAYRWHRSDTIDAIFIISGQMELLLDDGATVLGPGDTVVQRGTNHAWRVVGDEPCTWAGVLIDASPQPQG